MKLRSTLAVAALGLIVTAAQARAQTAFAIADDGLSLIRFDVSSPGSFVTVGNFSGAATDLTGLDFRPVNNNLYGLSVANTIVLIDPNTAVTTFVSTLATPSSTDDLGVDFNPVPDRLRLVNPDDQNLRINVESGATNVDGTLGYATGDDNEGVNPNVNEVAYINNDNDPATGTQLYYLDNELDILATTSNPNGGVLDTVGELGVDTDIYTGFDVVTSPTGVNTAYALLRVDGQPGLYTIDLGTGAATLVDTLGAVDDNIYGLAIAVPEPGSMALLISGLGAFTLARLRRRPR